VPRKRRMEAGKSCDKNKKPAFCLPGFLELFAFQPESLNFGQQNPVLHEEFFPPSGFPAAPDFPWGHTAARFYRHHQRWPGTQTLPGLCEPAKTRSAGGVFYHLPALRDPSTLLAEPVSGHANRTPWQGRIPVAES